MLCWVLAHWLKRLRYNFWDFYSCEHLLTGACNICNPCSHSLQRTIKFIEKRIHPDRGDLAEPPSWLRSLLFYIPIWATEHCEPIFEDMWGENRAGFLLCFSLHPPVTRTFQPHLQSPCCMLGTFSFMLSPLTHTVALLAAIISFQNNVYICRQTISSAHTDLGNLKSQT